MFDTSVEESIKQGLSKREALALTRLAGQNKTIVTVKDIEDALETTPEAAKTVASNLADKKWLDRLKRGTYLIVPLAAGETGEYTEHEFVIASHLAEPMYLSYWTALNCHGLTEQVPLTVFVATAKRVTDKEIHNIEYRFVTLTDSKFFGFEPVSVGPHQVNMATVEKAIVDCADHPEYCGGITELAKALTRTDNLNPDRLTEYLLRQGNGAAIKRVVYLADILDIELSRREELEDAFTTGYSKLDPTKPDGGKHDSSYRLQLNIDESELTTAGGHQ